MVVCSRRQFLRGGLALAGLGLLSGCGLPPLPGQAPAKVPRIGVVHGGSDEFAAPHFETLRQGLREHGYEQGRNILIEWRTLEGRTERAPDVMVELLGIGVAAIVTGNPASVLPARQATSTIPIIMAGAFGDPVEQTGGVVASFNRPGGNVTGLSLLVPTLLPKRLQLLKEAVPQAQHLTALWDRTLGPLVEARAKLLEETGPSVGFEVRSVFIQRAEELEPAFEAMRQDGADALNVSEGPLTVSHFRMIAGLALRHRLPGLFGPAEFVRAGGLIALGVDQTDLYRRAADYVHKVLQGADPAELPIEQPTKFDFVLNLKTAQALGLTLPPSVLVQATEVIQ